MKHNSTIILLYSYLHKEKNT